MTQEQIKALVQMVVTLVVTLCGIFGYSMAEETAQQVALVIVAVVVVAYSVWRNANFTGAAGLSQRITDLQKSGEIDATAVEAFIEVASKGIAADGKEQRNDGQ